MINFDPSFKLVRNVFWMEKVLRLYRRQRDVISSKKVGGKRTFIRKFDEAVEKEGEGFEKTASPINIKEKVLIERKRERRFKFMKNKEGK